MMIKKKYLRFVVVICLLFSGMPAASAGIVTVRILTTKVINTFIFSPAAGSYNIYGDGRLIADSVDPSAIYQMSIAGDSILLKTFEKTIGKFYSVSAFAQSNTSFFKIKSVVPESKVRMYDDHLTVQLSPDKK